MFDIRHSNLNVGFSLIFDIQHSKVNIGFGFKHIYSNFHLHSNIRMYILQYNYQLWWDSERSQTTYTNLFSFEENGVHFGVISDENKKKI